MFYMLFYRNSKSLKNKTLKIAQNISRVFYIDTGRILFFYFLVWSNGDLLSPLLSLEKWEVKSL